MLLIFKKVQRDKSQTSYEIFFLKVNMTDSFEYLRPYVICMQIDSQAYKQDIIVHTSRKVIAKYNTANINASMVNLPKLALLFTFS